MEFIIDTKERYLKAKAAWKKFFADKKHKKYKVPYGNGGQFRWNSDLKVLHHVIYALIRDKKLNKMFKQLANGSYCVQDLHQVRWDLRRILTYPERIYEKQDLEFIQRLFDGHVTAEDLALILRKLETIYNRTNAFGDLGLE
jgi:hypothetical protein